MTVLSRYFVLLLTVTLLGACATSSEKTEKNNLSATETIKANDYPTQDRVEYVLNCIAKHGGLTYINQYACVCKIDKLAEQLSFKEYDEARTFSQLYGTPGERGGVFRDPKQSKTLRERLKIAEETAEKACFVK